MQKALTGTYFSPSFAIILLLKYRQNHHLCKQTLLPTLLSSNGMKWSGLTLLPMLLPTLLSSNGMEWSGPTLLPIRVGYKP